MMQQISSVHRVDDAGNPAGGRTAAIGIDITWQDGPLGRDCDRDTDGDGNCPIHPGGCPTRQVPNGAFVEGVIEAAIDRIRFYQEAAGGKFKCRENALRHHRSRVGAELAEPPDRRAGSPPSGGDARVLMPKLRKLDLMEGDPEPDKMPTSFRCEPIAKQGADDMSGVQLGLRFWYWEEDQHFG